MNRSTSTVPAVATPHGSPTPSPGGHDQAQPTIVTELDRVTEELTAAIEKLDPAAKGPVLAVLQELRLAAQSSSAELQGIAINAQTKLEAAQQALNEAQEMLRTGVANARQELTDEARRKDTELSARADHLRKGYKWLAAGSVAGATLAVLSGLTLFRSDKALKQAQGFLNEGRAVVQQANNLFKPLQLRVDTGRAVSRVAVALRIMTYNDPNSKNYDTAYKALLDSVKTFKDFTQNGEISPEVRPVIARMYKGAFSLAKQAATSTGFTTKTAQENAKTASEEIVTAWSELMK